MRSPSFMYIVGDRFESITQILNAITISELEQRCGSQAHIPIEEKERKYILGQGVSERRYRELWQKLDAQIQSNQLTLEPPKPPEKASKFQTHKHNEHNIAIGQPQKIDAKQYRSRLLIDDQCDDIADHLTGFHVPGMCILEAARQLVLAVSEEFIIEEVRRGEVRFSTEKVSATYHGFILPLPTTLLLSEQRLRKAPSGDFVLTAIIDFVQGEKTLARVETTVSGISRQFVELRERNLISSIAKFHQSPSPVRETLPVQHTAMT